MYVVFPAAALVPLVIACCLGRIPRGVLLLIAGLTAALGGDLCLNWRLLIETQPAYLAVLGFLMSAFLLVGGFDAARRGVGRTAGRWAPLAPAMAMLCLSATFVSAVLIGEAGAYDALFFWPSNIVVRGLPLWLGPAVNFAWEALLAGAVFLAFVHALRPRRSRAIAGLLYGAAGTLTIIGFAVFAQLAETGYRRHANFLPSFNSTPPLRVFRDHFTELVGFLLLALGYSTLWRVSRKKKAAGMNLDNSLVVG